MERARSTSDIRRVADVFSDLAISINASQNSFSMVIDVLRPLTRTACLKIDFLFFGIAF